MNYTIFEICIVTKPDRRPFDFELRTFALALNGLPVRI
jgi:hypothetical protein